MTPSTRLVRRCSVLAAIASACLAPQARALEPIRVSTDGRGFSTASGRPFAPWGFNYDHDDAGRLIEDYWVDEWPKVEADFREMKRMGANVVRVHLQFARFMDAADRPNPKSLDQLGRLVGLADREGLYLDITGLACYRKPDVPAWYDALGEADRWAAQARFWEAVAGRCGGAPAVFCFDLMNEPLVPAERREPGDYLGKHGFAGRFYVQCLTLDPLGRPRRQVAREWTARMVGAIRRLDPRTLVTVGLVDWSLDRPGLLFSGFPPAEAAAALDFVSVHLYPKAGKVDEALATLEGFNVGKPVVVEETFPLTCPVDDLARFIDGSKARHLARGWIGFYWGRPAESLRRAKTIEAGITADWLEYFEGRKGRDSD